LKRFGYYFFRYWVAIGLFCYYRKIKAIGRENIPNDEPVLLLSNHQNALLDILLIATNCQLKPWFLTRADIFKNKFFKPLFTFLQMLPIYRIRDGKASLSKNAEIFKKCATLLNQRQAILLFPEANHNLERRVRALSKGFTRLIFSALAENQKLDIKLVPIGQNYVRATTFPDVACIYYGTPIAVQPLLQEEGRQSVINIKAAVSKALQRLTTHFDDSLLLTLLQHVALCARSQCRKDMLLVAEGGSDDTGT